MIIAIVLIVIIGVGFVGVWFLSQPAEPDVITIGCLGPLSGPASYNGEEMWRGVRLAVEEINANGGILGKELVCPFEDTQSDVETAAAIIEKFKYQYQVDAVCGFYHSGIVLANSPKIMEYKLPTMCPIVWHDNVTGQMSPYIFRICPTNTLIIMAGPFPAIQALEPERIAVMAATSDFGQGGAAVFEGLCDDEDYDVVIHLDIDREATTYYTELELVKAENPDWLHTHVTGRSVFLIKKEMYELDMNFPMFSAEGLIGDRETLLDSMTAEEAQGACYATMFLSGLMFTEKTAPFVAAYKEMFGGREPHYFSLHMYDGIMALADSMERAGTTDPDTLVTAIENLDFLGTRGQISFTYTADNPPPSDDIEDTLFWHQWVPPILFMQWQIVDDELTQVVIYPEELSTGEIITTWT
jgi:branched-chain amino acid transport system substrate-binding protein